MVRPYLLVMLFCGLVCVADVCAALCVIGEKANLRSGPGAKYKVSWTVGKYMPLRKITQKGSWVQVGDVDGETHWVSSSLVSEGISCVVVKSKTATLRSGPGSNFPPTEFGSAERFTPFKKVDRDNAWIQVEDEYKERFWIHENTVWMPLKRSTISF